MSIKCKACGFDSPDDAGWCDFCKEPFRKPAKSKPAPAAAEAPAPKPAPMPAPAPKPSAPAPASVTAAPTDPEVAALKKLPPEELFKRLPMELGKDSAGEKIPVLPSWFRPAAYAFTLGLALMGAILGLATVIKAHFAEPPQIVQPGHP